MLHFKSMVIYYQQRMTMLFLPFLKIFLAKNTAPTFVLNLRMQFQCKHFDRTDGYLRE